MTNELAACISSITISLTIKHFIEMAVQNNDQQQKRYSINSYPRGLSNGDMRAAREALASAAR